MGVEGRVAGVEGGGGVVGEGPVEDQRGEGFRGREGRPVERRGRVGLMGFIGGHGTSCEAVTL